MTGMSLRGSTKRVDRIQGREILETGGITLEIPEDVIKLKTKGGDCSWKKKGRRRQRKRSAVQWML